MNIESVREYCLSMPGATEDFPFDETTLAFRIGGKIFAMIDLERTEWFVLKCDPDRSLELRESYPEIAPAWHMNKKHWNQLNLFGHLPNELIEELIRHSYELVASKLPRRERFLTDERMSGEGLATYPPPPPCGLVAPVSGGQFWKRKGDCGA